MSEKPTFCPLCRHMHPGPCPQIETGRRRAQPPQLAEPVPPAEPLAFDKKAYQREYMRQRRAKAK